MKKINRKESSGVFYPQSDKGQTVTVFAVETTKPIKISILRNKLEEIKGIKIVTIASYGNAKLIK